MNTFLKNIIRFIQSAILFALVVGCGNSKKSKDSTNQAAEKADKINEIVQKEFKYPIPTAFQVTQLLQDAGAAYVLAVTNPVENVDKYETQRSKALNLGIYGADLSYASTYNKKDESRKLLQASKDLIDGLEVSNVFTQSMADRIEVNIENKDSLIAIITQSFYDTHDQLNKNGQDKIALLVVAGSWI